MCIVQYTVYTVHRTMYIVRGLEKVADFSKYACSHHQLESQYPTLVLRIG